MVTLSSSARRAFIAGLALLTSPLLVHADIAIETETGDLGKKGESNFSQGIQFDRDPDGRSAFLLTQYEYAFTDRCEILIEPFFYQWSKLKDGTSFEGLGDLEITPSYAFFTETETWPTLVAAYKVKVPMASNRDIGSGKFDNYPYLIINKHVGKWDFNANIGVSFFGQTKGDPRALDQLIYDFAVQHPITENLQIIAEVFGNTKAAKADPHGTFAGAVALEYAINEHFNVFVSVGYDSDKTWSVRPGFNIPF